MIQSCDVKNQNALRNVLQKEKDASKLECLAAALIGRLIGVRVAVSKSGFQHGADAGSAGRQGRHLRIECKKYADTTNLSDRELQGEIDDALRFDPTLEGWILVTTREVPEQTEQVLMSKGANSGLPIVILDWKPGPLSDLAALCAFAPDLVADIFSPKAGELARVLNPICGETVDRIRRDLQAWCLGFHELRAASLKRLQDIWDLPRVSNAVLGQNAAGGAREKRIRRRSVYDAFERWWDGDAKEDAPIAIVGKEGAGKTWAALDWLVDQQEKMPIVLLVPSSAVPGIRGTSEASLKQFFADRLYELTRVRDRNHWLHRLDNLLKRPENEGLVLTVFFDGLNQEPSISWLAVLKVLQGPAFAGRIRTIISTRSFFYEYKLSKLRGLIKTATEAQVDAFDLAPSGEFDQMLAFEGLTRSDLHPDLIQLAQTPRLFGLVISLRDRLIDAGKVTVHRLLWEYGRDSFGNRAERSFSESDWREWLAEIAIRLQAGIQKYSLKDLSETANRPDLTESEVYARLSDIVDSHFVTRIPSTDYQLTPTIVAHALGAALLNQLEQTVPATFDAIYAELTRWLDPIDGLDERAEVLRAAVSIFIECSPAMGSNTGGALVTAWLQSQNIPDAHRQEVLALASNLTEALLDTIEHSNQRAHASARNCAINALGVIDRQDEQALTTILDRMRLWYCVVSRQLDSWRRTSEEQEKKRSQRFIERVGIDASVPIQVMGVQLEFVDKDYGDPASAVAPILRGFPLAGAMPVFEAAAVSMAIVGHIESWQSLKWLCLLNEVDPEDTAVALRDAANAVRSRIPEPGINPALADRTASLLLWLTGQERDEIRARETDPGLDRWLTYEKDYLSHPARSLFALERRHAQQTLSDKTLSVLYRGERCRELWLDPSFECSSEFISEVRKLAAGIDVEKLYRNRGLTIEEHNFEELEPILARCAPDILASLARCIIKGFHTCPSNARYWSAIHATDHLILTDDDEAEAARSLRLRNSEDANDNESFSASRLLFLELLNCDGFNQAEIIITSGLKDIYIDFINILKPITPQESDILVTRFSSGTVEQQRVLLILLSQYKILFDDVTRKWLIDMAFSAAEEFQGFAFRALTRSDASRFGRELIEQNWSWSSDKDYWVNHYGSGALIEGSIAAPFRDLAPRLAPWRLLEAVRKRGSKPAEVRMAATVFGHILFANTLEVPDPGSQISVDRSGGEPDGRFCISVALESSDVHTDDPVAAIRAVMDSEARLEAYKRAVTIAKQRIDTARQSGASLYLTNVDAKDLKPVLTNLPEFIDSWIEEFEQLNDDFTRRVGLSEAAYLAICEALLDYDPPRGVRLWRSIHRSLRTEFIGSASVNEAVHIVFRAPDSPEIAELRDELVGLDRCHTDQELLNIAIAANCNGKSDWLLGIIEGDKASSLAWRRKRGLVLEGFQSHNNLPIRGAWPDHEIKTTYEELRYWAARFRYREACAHHWWCNYLKADDPDAAYASWILFMHSADRRAWIWMADNNDATDGGALFSQKMAHVQLNKHKLQRAMDKNEKDLNRNYLKKKIVTGLTPWKN